MLFDNTMSMSYLFVLNLYHTPLKQQTQIICRKIPFIFYFIDISEIPWSLFFFPYSSCIWGFNFINFIYIYIHTYIYWYIHRQVIYILIVTSYYHTASSNGRFPCMNVRWYVAIAKASKEGLWTDPKRWIQKIPFFCFGKSMPNVTLKVHKKG